MTDYVRKFEANTTMSFNVINKQLLKNYNQIYDSKPVYGNNDKYIKTEIKIYASSMITNLQRKKKHKEKAPCRCLPIIMLDSVIKAKKKYYP